ncbi:putative glucan endo-1,3-beta-glucosidase A6 [Camellia lanceoleosa]|uniref:Glucan endo-1,3-beta-glucosidase A6 n=1 Tax=Camellia lanceoleosa TaxID=1840588 RepID=A0ACC0I4W4_9ERIC|nr:putative glucan endo-1,3-beta-glucosidase A6 [Camellia lanceoleosa]
MEICGWTQYNGGKSEVAKNGQAMARQVSPWQPLAAFTDSNISVTVALPNELLSSAASTPSYTDTWVQSNILPYFPKTQIEAIAVGNEVFVDPNNTTKFLVQAMNNMYSSLSKSNLQNSIKISSPIALTALQTSYPSSNGSFKQELIEPVIKPMLNFLQNGFCFVNFA